MKGTHSGIRYDKAIRERALKMLADGVSASDVAAACGISTTTVHYWNRLYGVVPVRGESQPRAVKRKGSGVIAPAPYHRGSVWGAGH